VKERIIQDCGSRFSPPEPREISSVIYGVDFMVLASEQQSEPNDPNWNTVCDISEPKDDFIDEPDLEPVMLC